MIDKKAQIKLIIILIISILILILFTTAQTFQETAINPKIESPITNNGPVNIGSEITFNAKCENSDTETETKLIICRDNSICNLNTQPSDLLCNSQLSNTPEKTCSYKTTQFDEGLHDNDIATCCNDLECDTNPLLIENWIVNSPSTAEQIYDFVIPEQPSLEKNVDKENITKEEFTIPETEENISEGEFSIPEITNETQKVKIVPPITNNGPVTEGSEIIFRGQCLGDNSKERVWKRHKQEGW